MTVATRTKIFMILSPNVYKTGPGGLRLGRLGISQRRAAAGEYEPDGPPSLSHSEA